MIKRIIIFIFALFSILYSNDLNMNAKFSNKIINKNKENYLILSFISKNKIYLNFYPLLIIKIEKQDWLKFPKDELKANDLDIDIFEFGNNKYINIKKPIKIPFELKKKYKKGKYFLILTVKGFYTIPDENITINFSKKKKIIYYIK